MDNGQSSLIFTPTLFELIQETEAEAMAGKNGRDDQIFANVFTTKMAYINALEEYGQRKRKATFAATVTVKRPKKPIARKMACTICLSVGDHDTSQHFIEPGSKDAPCSICDDYDNEPKPEHICNKTLCE
jgi:hypothetical protein